MTTVYYPAIVERGRRGFGVFFPDLPGCTSAGDTLTEAAINAEEALAGHLIVAEQYGDPIPEPSPFETIQGDSEVDEVARLLVRAERPGKAKRINIMMDESLIEAIDRIASNRSGFLSDAARMAIAARQGTVTR